MSRRLREARKNPPKRRGLRMDFDVSGLVVPQYLLEPLSFGFREVRHTPPWHVRWGSRVREAVRTATGRVSDAWRALCGRSLEDW